MCRDAKKFDTVILVERLVVQLFYLSFTGIKLR